MRTCYTPRVCGAWPRTLPDLLFPPPPLTNGPDFQALGKSLTTSQTSLGSPTHSWYSFLLDSQDWSGQQPPRWNSNLAPPSHGDGFRTCFFWFSLLLSNLINELYSKSHQIDFFCGYSYGVIYLLYPSHCSTSWNRLKIVTLASVHCVC